MNAKYNQKYAVVLDWSICHSIISGISKASRTGNNHSIKLDKFVLNIYSFKDKK